MIYKLRGGGGGKTLIISNLTQKTSTLLLQSLQKGLFSDAEFVCFSYKVGSLPLYPTNNIILELQPKVAISSVLQMFGSEVTLEKNLGYNTYLLKVNQISRLLDIANQIYTSSLVKYAHPDFIAPIEKNNSLYPQQYYLNNTGQNGATANIDINAPEAWALLQNCTTTRIRVAVIDDGVEAHEDLNNLLPIGFAPLNTSGTGRPQGDCLRNTRIGHGQACAGIIGADDNQIGIRGVATNVEILPINIFTGNESYSDMTAAIDWAWSIGQADILSNSWGYGVITILSDAIVAAIQRARTLGRNGKGCIVIFSSGNGHQGFSGVAFPANTVGVITVGAVNFRGNITSYSSRGAEMDLVAPGGTGYSIDRYQDCDSPSNIEGGITTLDRMGASGYQLGNYKFGFGGTSAACPQVAGVAALMLQVNPNLTEVQIREILQQTARDLGATGFDNDMGYGLVDAEAAVKKVLLGNTNLSIISGGSTICSGSGYYSIPLAPAGATITWQVTGSITLTNGQGTSNVSVSANRSGGGTIRAIITNCGAFYQTPIFNVFVIYPPGLGVNYVHNNGSSMNLLLYAPSETGVPNPNNICLGYTSRGYLIASVSSGTVTFTAISGVTISYRDNRSTYINVSYGAVGIVSVTASNSCGTDIQTMAFKVTNCGYPDNPSDPTNPPNPCNGAPKLYNISPNPASGQIKIGVSEKPAPIECPNNPYPPKMQAMLDSKEGVTFSEVNIYNSFGTLVLSQKMDKAKEFTIPLNELRAGLYLVQISEGEYIERHQIIIE